MTARKYKTTSEAAIRACIAEGFKFPAIAERLGVSLQPLRHAASILGIKSPSKFARLDFGACLAGLEKGMTVTAIARDLGEPVRNVRYALKSAGLPTSARDVLARRSAEAKD